LAHNSRSYVSIAIFFAYLTLGAGSFVETPPNPDPERDAATFASTLPRKIYRYSVVPGGVFTPAELAAARRADPVVAAHFADFGPNTSITRLTEDMYVYVSYRKGDKVYWTKKKHKVCAGEVVITDGKNYARTRCANRISKVFKAPPIVYGEPKSAHFDVIEPPDAEMGGPLDPLLTENYYAFPNPLAPSHPGQSGASEPTTAYEPTLLGGVILPSLLPFAGTAPGLFAPLSTPPGGGGGGGGTGGGGGGTGGGGGGTGGGGGGPVVPEPGMFPLLLASSLFVFLLRRNNRLR
jgi:uncharacterized membrane protein YgcG